MFRFLHDFQARRAARTAYFVHDKAAGGLLIQAGEAQTASGRARYLELASVHISQMAYLHDAALGVGQTIDGTDMVRSLRHEALLLRLLGDAEHAAATRTERSWTFSPLEDFAGPHLDRLAVDSSNRQEILGDLREAVRKIVGSSAAEVLVAVGC